MEVYPMSTFRNDHRSSSILRWVAPVGLLVALSAVANAQMSETSRSRVNAANATTNTWAVTQRSSIVVQIDLIRSADYLTSNELTNITTRVQGNPSASPTIKQTFTEFRQLYQQTHQTDRPLNQPERPNNQRDQPNNKPDRPGIPNRPINQSDRIRP